MIIVIGVIGLLAALGIGKWLSEDRAPRGAVVLGVLSILSLPVFFSGAPASFGAMAAVRAGFARGGSPTSGAPRGFGIAGIVIAVLIIVAVFAGNISGIVESARVVRGDARAVRRRAGRRLRPARHRPVAPTSDPTLPAAAVGASRSSPRRLPARRRASFAGFAACALTLPRAAAQPSPADTSAPLTPART